MIVMIENCQKQRIDLVNLIKKQKNSKLLTDGYRVGVSGFRKAYVLKQETEVKLDKVVQENVELKRKNKFLTFINETLRQNKLKLFMRLISY